MIENRSSTPLFYSDVSMLQGFERGPGQSGHTRDD